MKKQVKDLKPGDDSSHSHIPDTSDHGGGGSFDGGGSTDSFDSSDSSIDSSSSG